MLDEPSEPPLRIASRGVGKERWRKIGPQGTIEGGCELCEAKPIERRAASGARRAFGDDNPGWLKSSTRPAFRCPKCAAAT
jgi:hypothetical protein